MTKGGWRMARPDGRDPAALRPVTLTRHYTRYAEGSVLIEVGDTRVLCTATLEDKVPPFLRGTGRGWVTAEYGMLPRATAVRTVRDSTKGQVSGRSQEIQRLIGRCLRSVVRLEALGERTVILDCDVLQADGGTRTAAVTGGFVALVDALAVLAGREQWERLPLTDFLAAVSVGVVGEEAVVDLSFAEDSRARMDMNVVATGQGRLVEVQATAEGEPVPPSTLEELLGLGLRAVGDLVAVQRASLGELADKVGRP